MNERVVVFLMLLLGSDRTLLTHGSKKKIEIDSSRNYFPSKLLTMPQEDSRRYVCLEVSDSLTPCNFNRVDHSVEEDLSFGKRNKRIKRRVENTGFVIVYKIEGCLPSRLPFRLRLCKHDEYARSTTEVRSLYPFQTPASSQSAPSIFPELDHSQWLRLMKSIGYRSESSDGDKRNMVFELEGVREEQTWPNRGRESIKSIQRKVAEIPEKYISNKILLQKAWLPTQNKKPFQAKKQRFKFRPLMHEEIKEILYKAQKIVGKNAQQVKNLGQEMIQLESEIGFPYSRAIPYDPEKLIVAQAGSEFPYSKAIPFDAKKLQVARERSVFPYWKKIPHRSKSSEDQSDMDDYTYLNRISFQNHLLYPGTSYHSRKLQSMKKDQAVSFDSSMLDAAKQGGVFPYSKGVPRNTSKNILKGNGSRERENHKRDIKTRVPLRDVNKDTTIKSHISRRSAGSSKTYKSCIIHRSRNLESIKEGSE